MRTEDILKLFFESYLVKWNGQLCECVIYSGGPSDYPEPKRVSITEISRLSPESEYYYVENFNIPFENLTGALVIGHDMVLRDQNGINRCIRFMKLESINLEEKKPNEN